VDADAEAHAVCLGQRLVASRDIPLDLDRALHGFHDARELGNRLSPGESTTRPRRASMSWRMAVWCSRTGRTVPGSSAAINRL
jgi:hypothetical protein